MSKKQEQLKIAIAYVHDFLVKSNLKGVAQQLLDQASVDGIAKRDEILRTPTHPLLGIINVWRNKQSANLKDNEWFAAECMSKKCSHVSRRLLMTVADSEASESSQDDDSDDSSDASNDPDSESSDDDDDEKVSSAITGPDADEDSSDSSRNSSDSNSTSDSNSDSSSSDSDSSSTSEPDSDSEAEDEDDSDVSTASTSTLKGDPVPAAAPDNGAEDSSDSEDSKKSNSSSNSDSETSTSSDDSSSSSDSDSEAESSSENGSDDSQSSSSDDSTDSEDETAPVDAVPSPSKKRSHSERDDAKDPIVSIRPIGATQSSKRAKYSTEDPSDLVTVTKASGRTTNIPFSRIDMNKIQYANDALRTNAYVGPDNEFGAQASVDLLKTRGKGFTKEKNKKKRGAYKGGNIDQTTRSFRFDN